jgi:hypothetical protein
MTTFTFLRLIITLGTASRAANLISFLWVLVEEIPIGWLVGVEGKTIYGQKWAGSEWKVFCFRQQS